ncbi:thiamine pyrophosphate-binding protein [Streptomyces sp. NBC_00083]|uniref:thiamine pyrophosphate-binding protein n=1 Tax=Streptomyces sp. NBC_00083 TaxID=2975647 RepID=UPI00224DD5E9|nr:thiamine pyrophosphate-binding protein [Streptomyces sp. NBC_00083]MCX5384692.1 thiamine pyrophosphate-binding protein [Streptomyces sp. NBC_00083]
MTSTHSPTAVDPVGLSGAALVLDVLQDEGVRHVFGNPGTTELPLIQQLASRRSLQYVLALQEASAVAMADGHARITGRPAFVNLHAAAGLGNGIGALTNAAAARVPLVVTAGQQDLRHLIHAPVLAGDLTGLARATVKWAHQVSTRTELGTALRQAFRMAMAPPTGPVFLSLPMNLLDEIGPAAPRITTIRYAAAAPTEDLAKLLHDTPHSSIALVYGDELARHAPAEGLALAEKLQAPVWGTGWPATNPFPTRHPLWRGYLPTHVPGIHETLSPYRLVISAGAQPFPLYYPYAPGPLLHERTTAVQITEDPSAPGRDTPIDLALHGQLQPTLSALLDVLPACAAATHTLPDPPQEAPAPSGLGLPSAAEALAATLPAHAIVVDEAPQAAPHIRAALDLRHANQYQWVAGGLGWAIPAAIGASLARGRGTVLCTIGDGAALYSPQALWTAAHLELPIAFVITNNSEYGVLKANWHQREPEPSRLLGMDLNQPAMDFVALSHSMGVPACRVESATDLTEALVRGYATHRPFLIDVHL